jgi:very-short-patch-repair endonuclease
LARTLARYSGLPLERARSGAEILAMETLRNEAFVLPRLNFRIAGEEADLSWPEQRIIIELDGGPFHQDVGEDERKDRIWREAGWQVRRLPTDHVYERPRSLISLAQTMNVPRQSS